MFRLVALFALFSSLVIADDVSPLGIPAKPVIAHRGASALAPEETKPAYLLARELGADYLEVDIHRTKSETSNPDEGVLVAIHDEELSRTSNVKKVFPNIKNPKVGDLTYTELLQLDFGSWYNAKFKTKARKTYQGLKIITLEQLIDIAEGGKNKPGLYIETKSPELYPGIEKNIVDVLDKRGWLAPTFAGKVIFQSFEITSLARFQRLVPNVPRVYLTPAGAVMADTIKQAKMVDATGVGPFALNATTAAIDEAHAEKLIVHPYVFNAEWQMKAVEKNGADGFFTDNCEIDLARRGKIKSTDVATVFKKIGF